MAYGRKRKEAAEKLGIPVILLDKIVDKERQKLAAEAKAEEDEWVSVDDTRPWSQEVDGAELLDDLVATISSFVIMSKKAAVAVALWVLFTWCFAVTHSALKLRIKSAEKRSGKTRLIEILSYLVRRPLAASRMTPAAFFRLIDAQQPTLLLDEFDSFAAQDENFRGILNAGFDQRFSVAWVCVGDDKTPTPFSLWTPQVISGIGSIQDTVADRCLKIELERKLRSQKVQKLRRRGTGVLEELAQKCARWAEDNIGDLAKAEPDVPESINDRAADGWELLLAIADQVGDQWPQRARDATIYLSGDGDYPPVNDESVGIQLLYDVREVLQSHPPLGETDAAKDKVPGANLVKWLVNLEDRSWIEIKHGQPLTQHGLAMRLRKFQIRPKSDGEVRGYSRAAFQRVFDRYLPPLPPGPDPSPSGGRPNGLDETSSRSDHDSPIQTVKPPEFEDSCGSQSDFKPSDDNLADGFKRPGNPSETTKTDSLTPQNGKTSPSEGAAAVSAPTPNPRRGTPDTAPSLPPNSAQTPQLPQIAPPGTCQFCDRRRESTRLNVARHRAKTKL